MFCELLFLLFSTSFISIFADFDLHVFVLSQNVPFEIASANSLHRSLSSNQSNISVTLLHEYAHNASGAWALWPMLRGFSSEMRSAHWTMFCSPFTRIRSVPRFLRYLAARNHTLPEFIGRALEDERPVIIHHFDTNLSFQYSDLSTGIILSRQLLKQLISALWSQTHFVDADFTIDPSFEFSKFVLKSTAVKLLNNHLFCLAEAANDSEQYNNDGNEQCLTEFRPPNYADECVAKNERYINGENVFYAVKTHSANHRTRIVVVKNTWAKMVKFIAYFSDLEDLKVPAIDLGVPNTKTGHCAKTFAIIRHFVHRSAQIPSLRWLVIADDDTLISVPRLHQLISCNFSTETNHGAAAQSFAVIIGQRYGYGFGVDGRDGFAYPTGGAGMVFSRAATQKLIAGCECPKPDAPDDMVIGLCARQLGVPIVHSDAFHQAQPNDYPSLHLRAWSGRHISFHKFEHLDPFTVYNAFLLDEWGTETKNRRTDL